MEVWKLFITLERVSSKIALFVAIPTPCYIYVSTNPKINRKYIFTQMSSSTGILYIFLFTFELTNLAEALTMLRRKG